MGFNKNKWSVFIEPTYQQYNTSKEFVYFVSGSLSKTTIANVQYKSIELPIGLRYYMFLNDESKLFLNVANVFDFGFDSSIDFDYHNINDLELYFNQRVFGNLAVGLGYNYNNKYNVEFRYGGRRNILANYIYWNADYNSFSFIFGYNLF